MTFEFSIPLSLADLVKSGGINEYVVREVLSPRQFGPKINEFEVAFRSSGPLAVLEHFDTPYSVLHHFTTADLDVKETTLELLLKGEEDINQFGCVAVAEVKGGINRFGRVAVAEVKGGRKRKVNVSGFDWVSEREQVIQTVTHLLQLDIRRLWNLSMVEEEFVSLITCCCYKVLENPNIGQVKYKGTREAVSHLLGVMVKCYNHALGQKSTQELARESSGVKAYAAFLMELSENIPAIMICSISVLLDHLDGESYTMRNALLFVMGEMVVHVLSGEQLEDSARHARDQFLDTLQEHIHDVHSFVRSKVLQIFTRIVGQKALPLTRFQAVVTLAVGRLFDKSINVCKNAIQLLAVFMANNPFSWKLSSADLQAPLEKETAKLREMREKRKAPEPALVIETWEEWDAMEPELASAVEAVLRRQSEEEEEEEEAEAVGEGETAHAVAERIVQFLRTAKYRRAVRLVLVAMERFEELEPFVRKEKRKGEEEEHVTQEEMMSILGSFFKVYPKLGKSGVPFRLCGDHQLFTSLVSAVTDGFTKQTADWLPFAERAVALVYQLAENPDHICAEMLRSCCRQMQAELVRDVGSQQETTPEDADATSASVGPTVPAFLLAHLLSLAGDVALEQVVHLERAVGTELRRRRVILEELEAKKKSSKQHNSKECNESTMEEEMGLVGASADDSEAELIHKICNTELLDGKQLLSAFVPLILKVCGNPGKYSDPDLTTTASLALSKFMMISTEFCDSQLRLLFTMLEKSPLHRVRSNIVIALGDLSIRFPNLLEPWTPHLYSRLRDSCPSVRRTSAVVMTHLILKDLVKVKGQISEMAVLLVDPEEEIAGLARNFFNELSGKDNAVYNLLPDVISRLSDPDCGVEEDPFRTIMRQLFSYITKDKQTESLVEKLCQRFRTARGGGLTGWCSMVRVAGGLTGRCGFTYGGSVLFWVTLQALIDEFEQKITACHGKGLENLDTAESQPLPATTTKKPAGRKNGSSRPLSAINRADHGDSSFLTPKPRSSKQSTRSQKKLVVIFSSDEEEEEEEDEDATVEESETPKVTTPIRRTPRRTRAK
nr:PREDICTED: condensin complex subunit 1 [Latimeria chalumnae]|eukprot:XP_014349218.1 PREDICTED: condensin complex subunit 1 [Latimeria chalumnae]